jgi:DNA-binding transcriptional MerR regulator
MTATMSIGDFSRATNLSIKTLRFYHESALLDPAQVDANSGYRRYSIDQIPTAQVIRRFRELDMPLDQIRAILAAPDVRTRNELIAVHLRRLQDGIERTQQLVASLQDLLAHPGTEIPIAHRSVPKTHAAAIREVIRLEDAPAWYQGALGELFATLSAQGITPSGPAGGLFSAELFSDERGAATVFVPCPPEVRPVGRVSAIIVPSVELAVATHTGSHSGIDREYGALGSYVTEHALAVDGPLREYYVVGAHDTADAAEWRTEIGWPIFATGSTG